MKLLLIGIVLAAVAAVLVVRALRKRAAKKVVPAPAKVEHKPVFGPYTPGHDPDEDKYWRHRYK